MNTELLTLLEKDARVTPAQLATMLGREEKDVAEEIADAMIMLEQLQIMLDVEPLVEKTVGEKIERLRRRLEP